MKKFTLGQRITCNIPPLKGIVGTVERICVASNGAWVKMESKPIEAILKMYFPFSNARDHRCNWTLLYPSQCKKEKKKNK